MKAAYSTPLTFPIFRWSFIFDPIKTQNLNTSCRLRSTPRKIPSGEFTTTAYTPATCKVYTKRSSLTIISLLNRNDILRQHGIIPEKPKDPEPLIQEALIAAQHRAHENRLEDKDLDELDALEEEEDEDFLAGYR